MNLSAFAKPLLSDPGKHVLVAGLGAIGAPLCEMLTRTEAVKRLTLVDKDVYEERNFFGQAGVLPSDFGKPKAFVQAEKARRARRDLQVEPIHAALEDVPLSRYCADVVLTGLDSKDSRQQASQRTWRVGVPWVDAGVMAERSLVRVTVFLPGEGQPCLECAWDERDYQTLEVKRPCQESLPTARTGAPVYLGSLATALQMAACSKILAADSQSISPGVELTLAVGSHKLYETRLRKLSTCRFDHRICQLRPLPCDPATTSLRQLIHALKAETQHAAPVRFRIEGKRFVRQLRCACGTEKATLFLQGRVSGAGLSCPACGALMAAVGFSMLPDIDEKELAAKERERLLSSLGLVEGDVVVMEGSRGLEGFELKQPESK